MGILDPIERKGEKTMMICKKLPCQIEVNNLPSYDLDRYTVFRLDDGDLWFYGTYENEDRAKEVAHELGNALVVEFGDEVVE